MKKMNSAYARTIDRLVREREALYKQIDGLRASVRALAEVNYKLETGHPTGNLDRIIALGAKYDW